MTPKRLFLQYRVSFLSRFSRFSRFSRRNCWETGRMEASAAGADAGWGFCGPKKGNGAGHQSCSGFTSQTAKSASLLSCDQHLSVLVNLHGGSQTSNHAGVSRLQLGGWVVCRRWDPLPCLAVRGRVCNYHAPQQLCSL